MRTTIRSFAPPAASVAADPLAAATGIGHRLLRDAVFYRRQCNWVGGDAGAAHGLGSRRPLQRALGPDLGGGTAGVALFLAQLQAATGDTATRRVALGAIEQALAHVDQVPVHAARGFYAGRPGIAYAAARCGLLLGEERLLQRAARLARAPWPRSAQFDLVAGTAGTIAGLLALARVLDDDRHAQRAAQLGDELAGAARRGREGWSWPVPGAPRSHGLCGMSQGAAGAAWALLELFAVTGEHRHRDAAARALDYERGWFDEQQGDWPDLRGVDRRERRGSFTPPFVTSWSHGAPGIALSRLRAWQILGEPALRAEALAALTTTASAVQRALLAPRPDFTLGHGLAGSADVLLLGAALSPEGATLAGRVAEIGIGRYATSLDGWPAAVPAARTPALLTGDAGIGLLLLRLHDPAIASALLVGAPVDR
jgi:lantibiotic modifying enzyme